MNITSSHISSDSPKFKGEVLRQIYRVWLLRKLLPVLVIEIALFSFVLYQLGRIVFVQRVLENAFVILFSHPSGIFSFITATFLGTTFFVKVLSIGLVVLLAFFLRHLTQGILRFILVRENYFSRIRT